MKRIIPIFLFFILLSSGCFANRSDSKNDIKLIGEQHLLETQGRVFEKQGDFESAIQKYNEAIKLDYQIYGSTLGRPLAFKAEVYEKQGKYTDSLIILKDLIKAHPDQENYLEWKKELEALIDCEKRSDTEFVYAYIKAYKTKYQKELPPQGYSLRAESLITRILALYDTIGDYDAGIKYIDEILDYKLSRNKNIIRPSSSEEALQFSKRRDTIQDQKNRRSYEVFAEYLLIREAFEQDKAEGKKGSMKEGKPGRATLALIKSDYFPW